MKSDSLHLPSMASPGRALGFMLQCRQTTSALPHVRYTSHSQAGRLATADLHQPSHRATHPGAKPRHRVATPPPPRSRQATEVRVENRGPSIWTAVKQVMGISPKRAEYTPAPFTAITNPYRARKSWPPDFSTLHPKHQFHYEKTYRRRMKLKYARPRWTRGTKIVQWGLIYGVLFYWIFFLKVEGSDSTPFDSVSPHAR